MCILLFLTLRFQVKLFGDVGPVKRAFVVKEKYF